MTMMSYQLYNSLKNLWESIVATPGSGEADPGRDVPDSPVIRRTGLFGKLHSMTPASAVIRPPQTGKPLKPRAEMPQIKGKYHQEFFDWLKAKGIEVWQDEVMPGDLHPSQSEIDLTKVARYLNDPDGTGLLDKRIIVTNDNQILDGHHHWMARLHDFPDQPMPVWRIGKKLKKTLKLAGKFPKTKYLGLGEWTEMVKLIDLDS